MIMDEGLIGVVVLCFIAIVVSTVFHKLMKSYWFAIAVSAITSSAILHLVSYLWVGYLDSFFMISFVIGLFISVFVSAVVGSAIHTKEARYK